jgi:triosephosphate isomerase
MKQQAQRPTIIAGNWKMHMTIVQAQEFISQLGVELGATDSLIYLAVPATALSAAVVTAEQWSIVIGGQNMHYASEGAFTGEVSGSMLLDAGARFVLIGHSERRHVFNEDDRFLNRKVHRAIETGLQPIFCVGETLEEREEGDAEAVIARQVSKGLDSVLPEQLRKMVIAYEPVWAIGTGKTATSEQVQQAHECVRRQLSQGWGAETAEIVPILYGGSVKPANARRILSLADVDGVLVGGASLEVASFAAIARCGMADLAN